MNEKDFLDKFIDLTDTEDVVEMTTDLNTLEEWDSLSVISFIAMANANYGIKLKLENVKAALTVADLYKLFV